MNILLGLGVALWFGILTSIMPCPLATNIAAISYISRGARDRKAVLLAGLLYTIGRVVTYVVLAIAIIAGLLATPALSHFLQKYMHQLLGPLLVITGMFLLELLTFSKTSGEAAGKMGKRVAGWGLCGSLALGMLFALTFCPTSAALFFGSLIPLALERGSRVAIPLAYGVGTALPVVVFAVIIAFSAHALGKAFGVLHVIELWARRITGGLFIVIGIWLTLYYVFSVH